MKIKQSKQKQWSKSNQNLDTDTSSPVETFAWRRWIALRAIWPALMLG